MPRTSIRERLLEEAQLTDADVELLFLDPPSLDAAIVGLLERFTAAPIVVYDRARVLEVLQQEGMSWEEALEWYSVNMLGSWVGDGTPGFLVRLTKER